MENISFSWGKEKTQAALSCNGLRVTSNHALELLKRVEEIATSKFRKELKEKGYTIEDLFDKEKEREIREISTKYLLYSGYRTLFAYPVGVSGKFFQENIAMLQNEFSELLLEETVKPQEKRVLDTAYAVKILEFITDLYIEERDPKYFKIRTMFYTLGRRSNLVSERVADWGGYLKTENVTTKKKLDLFQRGSEQDLFTLELRSQIHELFLENMKQSALIYQRSMNVLAEINASFNEERVVYEFKRDMRDIINRFEERYFSEDPCFIE